MDSRVPKVRPFARVSSISEGRKRGLIEDEAGTWLGAMAAMVNKTAATKAIGFLRQSFSIFRTLSASAVPPPSSDGSTDPKKPKRRKKKNLFEVAQFLPNWGIGYKMAKSHWRDVSYEITKINLYKDGRHGKAWGIRYKAGLLAAEAPVKMSGVHKRGWKYIPESEKKRKNAKKLEEQRAAAA